MKTRRAISSVVGTVFAIIALSSTIAYVTYSMNTLDQYNQSVITKNQQLSDINNEKFQISSVSTLANGKLNITVANTGTLPIKFTKLWVQNTTTQTTSTSWVHSYVPTNYFVTPGSTLTNLGNDIPLTINPLKSYNLKLVTSRGNTQQFIMNSVSTAPLNIQFYALPSNIDAGYTTELVMLVKNNGTSTLTNVVPNQPSAGAGAANYILSAQPTPASYNTLPVGSTAVFKWDVILTGTAGQSRTFNATLANGYNHNYALTTVTIGTTSSISSGPLNMQLLALPVTIPSGFKTELVMIVINNDTGTLTNVAPATPVKDASSNAQTCTLGTVSPASYQSLAPGAVAVFQWDLTVTGDANQFCKYTGSLQNGYIVPATGQAQTTAPATATVTKVTLASTDYAANAGVITNDYTSFKWTQSNSWNTDWSIPASGTRNDFQTTMANNNQTAGGYSLWLSKQSQIVFVPTFYNGNSVHPPSAFFIVGSVGLASGQGCSSPFPCIVAYTDYSKGLQNQGGIGTVYFGASTAGGTTNTGTLDAGNYYGFIILYGKFCINSNDNNCGNYAQTIPFYALVSH